jgi:hypothetical protein
LIPDSPDVPYVAKGARCGKRAFPHATVAKAVSSLSDLDIKNRVSSCHCNKSVLLNGGITKTDTISLSGSYSI